MTIPTTSIKYFRYILFYCPLIDCTWIVEMWMAWTFLPSCNSLVSTPCFIWEENSFIASLLNLLPLSMYSPKFRALFPYIKMLTTGHIRLKTAKSWVDGVRYQSSTQSIYTLIGVVANKNTTFRVSNDAVMEDIFALFRWFCCDILIDETLARFRFDLTAFKLWWYSPRSV